MRISVLTDGIYPFVMGGMQKHSYYLAKYLAREKIFLDLYHYIPSDNKKLAVPFSDKELKYISLYEVKYPKAKKFPGHYLYERYQYSKKITNYLIENDAPDFIYVQGFSGWNFLKNRKKLKIKCPIGLNFHGYEMFQRWPDFKTGMKLQILKQPVLKNISRADFIFSLGGKLNDIIKSKGFSEKIIEIPNGISLDWIINANELNYTNVIKFCFVGRAERRKGIEELNIVLSQIEKNIIFEFHFVGPIEESLQIRDERVFYHGPIYDQERIQSILRMSDVLVCPSYSEGMPNVILEGMASGCAIIATDIGAVSEMVDSSNGFLIEGNILQGLKRAFAYFFSLDSFQLHEMKLNSINKVKERFTWDKVIKETISKIEQCL